MACRVHESGTSIKGKGFLTKEDMAPFGTHFLMLLLLRNDITPNAKRFLKKRSKKENIILLLFVPQKES
jgi:hypothetical protein